MLPAHYLCLPEVDSVRNKNLFPLIILLLWSLYEDQNNNSNNKKTPQFEYWQLPQMFFWTSNRVKTNLSLTVTEVQRFWLLPAWTEFDLVNMKWCVPCVPFGRLAGMEAVEDLDHILLVYFCYLKFMFRGWCTHLQVQRPETKTWLCLLVDVMPVWPLQLLFGIPIAEVGVIFHWPGFSLYLQSQYSVWFKVQLWWYRWVITDS